MWNCKNCKEQNEDSFDICWKCGYGVDGETPNEIESEVEIIQKDTKEMMKAEDEKYRKKKRWIIFLIFLPFIMGFVSYFLKKPGGIDGFYPLVKSTLYDIRDINESKTIKINWSNEQHRCIWIGLQNSSTDFTESIIRAHYQIDIFDSNETLLKSKNIYNNRFAFPSGMGHNYHEYTLYSFKVPFDGDSKIKIRLTTKEIPQSFNEISSNTSMVIRKAYSCAETKKEREEELKEEKYYASTIIRKDNNSTLKPLYKALEDKDFNSIKRLLETKFDINISMLGDRTPIHYASYYNDIKTLKYLIDRGVDIYQKDILGYNPAQYAIGNSSIEALRLLVANGIDIKKIYYVPRFGYMGQGQKRHLFDSNSN